MPHRPVIRLLIALALMPMPILAQAHAILEESAPSLGATVPQGPLNLRLRYNSRIDRARSRLVVIRPDHGHAAVRIDPNGPPDIIAANLNVLPGPYVLRWQVLAVDGHITRGDLPFTVAGP